ncbi:hypothetical protein ONS95_012858 [Cadophora gregata]|uniref:uncharacterized protein n=1 Tax=Cadophora gregata TaxID=51156 RepID=UPI0026DB745A|nr:uncharacterized protein ONS95_012858 [Cadophora gregata]KAK0101162.1 hypothetical protein ONS96_006384 [Cadophora gregata f. sp. sojae]KAK0115807.1 hypothetical protein ONS95_012858 [Cadophora gregata]
MSPATATSAASMALITPSLTTTFMPKITACTENRLTMLANRAFQIWMNAPVPVPGTTFTDCYPSQYITSLLLSAGSVTQPAFAPLICPQHYSAVGPYTSNYIACCPSAYSLAQPESTVFKDRPAFGGTCYSNIDMATPVLVTAYGSSSVTATSYFTATVTNAQAYAYPIDGYAFGVAEIESKITSGLSTPTASPGSSVTSAAAATYTVLAGKNSAFTPNSVTAKAGDTVIFQFTAGNHTVTESTFERPCVQLQDGIDSGYHPIVNSMNPSDFSFKVGQNTSQWFFSKQAGECGQGMTFALNPTNEQTESQFQLNAVVQNGTLTEKSSGTSTGVKVGASLGAVAGVALIVSLTFFVLRRSRRSSAKVASKPNGDDTITKSGAGSSYTDTEAGNSPVTEVKPVVPPKGEELHGYSSPSELGINQDPAELMSAQTPVELSSPHEYHPPTFPNGQRF